MAEIRDSQHHLIMAKRTSRPNPKPQRAKNYVREWRKHRGFTIERLADLVDRSVSAISQLESGKQGYSDEVLAAIAYALNCDAGDLLSRDPTAPDYQLWKIIVGMKPEQRAQALRLIKALEEEAA